MKNYIKMAAELTWSQWLWGLLNAIIGGAATSGWTWLMMAGLKQAGVDVPALNFKALGVIMLSGGVTSLLFYLKQSPIPALTTTSEKTTTITTTTEKKQQ